MRSFVLYGLREPGESIRYIGITSRPLAERLNNHIHTKSRDHRGFWVSKIRRESGTIEIVPICGGLDQNEACLLEIEVLKELKLLGIQLVNTSLGGQATMFGRNHSEVTRRKISETLRGRKLPWDHINNSAASRRGQKKSPEHILKLALGRLGKKTKKNTSGFPGVSWNKKAKKWRADFMWNYKTFHCGYFENIQDAVIAREKMVKERITMDGAFNSLKVGGKFCVVQDLARKYKEDCQLRLAKITNGKHPDYQKGKQCSPK